MIIDAHLEKASNKLVLFNQLTIDGRDIQIAAILPHAPLLSAPWYTGRQVHIIAIDVDGNFILRKASGAVIFWDHTQQSERPVAASIKAFTALLVEMKGK